MSSPHPIFGRVNQLKSSRREIKQIEQRKRERRKRLETRKRKQEEEREERLLQIMAQNPHPQMAMLQNGGNVPMMSGAAAGMPKYVPPPPPPADNSGNPYAPQGYRSDARY
jgi:hypothetical protein